MHRQSVDKDVGYVELIEYGPDDGFSEEFEDAVDDVFNEGFEVGDYVGFIKGLTDGVDEDVGFKL